MMDNIVWSYGIMFLGIFIAGVAQVLLKKAAKITYSCWIYQYLNGYVFGGYGLMLLSTICTVVAMKRVPLTTTPIWNAFGIIWATFWGWFIFHEKISWRKGAGIFVILIGIGLFFLF